MSQCFEWSDTIVDEMILRYDKRVPLSNRPEWNNADVHAYSRTNSWVIATVDETHRDTRKFIGEVVVKALPYRKVPEEWFLVF